MPLMRTATGTWLLLLLLVGSGRAAEAAAVDTADELLAALAAAATPGGGRNITVELREAIALQTGRDTNYTLPFVYENGTTLTLQGASAGGRLTNLDLGQIPSLLYLKSGATLIVSGLNISNPADPQLGAFPDTVDSPTVIQSLPLWPTFGGDAGFTASNIIRDSNYTLHPSELCTPAVLDAQISALQELAVSSGSAATNLYSNGTTAYGTDWAAPVPVLSRVTRVAIGTVNVSSTDSQLHCVRPSNGTAGGRAILPVTTATQFFDALAAAAAPGAPPDTVLDLYADVALTQEQAATYALPFVIAPNHSLTIRGAAVKMRTLDLGQIDVMVFMQPLSTLAVDMVNVSNSASPYYGSWPDPVNTTTVIQFMPLWPTFGGDPNFTFVLTNTNFTLYPSNLCDPATIASQVATLIQVAEAAGSPASNITTSGTVASFNDWASPLPVLDKATRASIGRIQIVTRNSTLQCVPQSSAPLPAPDPAPADGGGTTNGSSTDAGGGGSGQEGGGGGGTPGWVWAIVGVGAAAALALAVGALLWRRRRARRLQERQLQFQSVEVHSGGDGKKPLTTLGPSSDRPGSLHTPNSSGAYEALATAKSGVPEGYEGYWKTRVGFIDGLQLGGLIGRGGYARVYKGRWKGTMVAVKVVATVVGPAQRYDLKNEPLLSLSLSHPNVLQAYKMCAVKLLTDGGEHPALATEQPSSSATGSSGEHGHSGGSRGLPHSGGSGSAGGRVVPHLTDPNCLVEVMPSDAVLEPGMYEMWLVSELADKGTLADAMAAGRFAQGEPPGRNMPMILLCLLDVARGLEYLHSCNIVHGDLKPQNVLLRTSGTDRRGFVCKLGDFGLSRMLRETETHVDTGSYGTVTHASPELLKQGRLTKASDIFAFAMILWELITGERLFPDMHGTAIIVQVTQHGFRPTIPAEVPEQLAGLVQRCWAEDPLARPLAETIVQELIGFNSSFSSAAIQRRDAAAAAVAAAPFRQVSLRSPDAPAPPPSFLQDVPPPADS